MLPVIASEAKQSHHCFQRLLRHFVPRNDIKHHHIENERVAEHSPYERATIAIFGWRALNSDIIGVLTGLVFSSFLQ